MTDKRLYLTANYPHSREVYVCTGERRPPKAGEQYLSGALPQVWTAQNDLRQSYPIMRLATSEEICCPHCGQYRADLLPND